MKEISNNDMNTNNDQNIPYSDEEVEQRLEELKQWHEKNLLLFEDEIRFSQEWIKPLNIIYLKYEIEDLLMMQRPDIAIQIMKKKCSEENSLIELYLMVLGFLYLSSSRFDDAKNMFEKSLHNESDTFLNKIIKPGCYVGFIFTYLGLDQRESAIEMFKFLSEEFEIGNIEGDSELIDTLSYYFSVPEGLYKLSISHKLSFNTSDRNDIEQGNHKNLIFHFPFDWRFDLDIDFAREHGIDTQKYPIVIPAHNINTNDAKKHMTDESQEHIIDPFMEELNRQKRQDEK